MAKKKAKGKKKKNQRAQGDQSSLGFLGTSVQQIATTIAGLIATQLVEAIVERLSQKFPILQTEEKQEVSDRPQEVASSQTHPIQEAALFAEETPKEVVSGGNYAVSALKTTVAEVAPTIDSVVDLFKNGAQQVLQKSEAVLENRMQPMVEGLTNAAQGIVEQVNSNSSEPAQKKKKKDKKKKKKG